MAGYKILSIFVVAAVLILLILATSGNGFFHRRKSPPSGNNDIFRRLRIERFEEPLVAPDFTLKDLKGNQVTLKNLRGRVVFLNFWATWCPPCRLEMPSMERLYKQLKHRGLVVLAVDMQENERQVTKFMKDFQLSFPALLDIDGVVSSIYGILGLPTTYIIDHEGKIAGRAVGPRDWARQESMQLFQRLLEETAFVAP